VKVRHRVLGDRLRRRRRRAEDGYAAVVVAALLASGVFVGMAAVSVDISHWYREMEGVQKASDAAALAGVPFMPQDLAKATERARDVAKRNGYDHDSALVDVLVSRGELPTELKVTISSQISNQFGSMIGVDSQTISRSATANYKGAAPMGSPCNTFGNEPNSGNAAPVTAMWINAICQREPKFWATMQGPEVDKVWGDRYQSLECDSNNTYECSGGENAEYDERGYFFVVRVAEEFVNAGRTVDLQLYDPTYIRTGENQCDEMPSESSFSNNPNPYATDAKVRYGRPTSSAGRFFCTNDHESGTNLEKPMVTSFVLREQTDTLDPLQGDVVTSTSGQRCITQYGTLVDDDGDPAVPTVNQLRSDRSAYNLQLAQTFHNWVSFCSFTPTRAGDYYVQVRTNVSTSGGTPVPNNGKDPLVFTGNLAAAAATGDADPKGSGDNSFAMRAHVEPGYEKYVSVAGYERMPIYANGTGTSSTFNLIQVMPGAAGQYISFSFYDIGDASSSGTVRVSVPSDATGSVTTMPFPGRCTTEGTYSGGSLTAVGTESDCATSISNSRNNGELQTINIPIPNDYTCNYNEPDGCWYKVTVSFGGGANVSDITTWDASVVADPVRLVE
jgi:Flp pilus assembly protein TadG